MKHKSTVSESYNRWCMWLPSSF